MGRRLDRQNMGGVKFLPGAEPRGRPVRPVLAKEKPDQ